MEQTTPSPTRMNLMQRKLQIALAKQGVDLLKNKRDALIKEFFALVKPLIAARQKIQGKLDQARWQLFLALGYDGETKVRQVAFAAKRDFEITATQHNLWGIKVPTLSIPPLVRSPFERGYSVRGTSTRIDHAALSFEELTEVILEMVPLETKLKKMGEEIKKTSRRVNALEQQLIPRLSAEKRRIQQALEEREREDVFRLKRIKQKD